MKLIGRYTAVLIGLFLVILFAVGWERVAREEQEVIDETSRDHQVLGEYIRATAVDTAGSPGSIGARIEHTMAISNRLQHPTRLEWISGDSASSDFAGGISDTHHIEGDALVSLFPLRMDGQRIAGAIRIRESLAEGRARVRRATWIMVESMATFVLVASLIALAVGRSLVANPIHAVVQKARRAAKGDFAQPLAWQRTDEIGSLATEIDAMCTALSAAHMTVLEETRRRLSADNELRHAERLATAGKLAAGVAHELGTPLSVISGRAQMIASGEVTGEKAKTSAASIEHEAGRIGRIVRQLLDFVRRKGPDGSPSNVAEVVSRTLTFLEPIAAQKQIGMTTTNLEEAARVALDAETFQQIVTNLVRNAVDAMSAGGVLTIAARNVKLSPPKDLDAPPSVYVRVDVADNGPGIPENVREHIFEPFFTTKAPGEGTGLGLSVVYGIVEDHGGWIGVESSPRGTTFSVFLPQVMPS